MGSAKVNQIERVLRYMRKNGSITQKEANHISVARLASRISDMKQAGYHIVTHMESGKNQYGEPTRYARYFLREELIDE